MEYIRCLSKIDNSKVIEINQDLKTMGENSIDLTGIENEGEYNRNRSVK